MLQVSIAAWAVMALSAVVPASVAGRFPWKLVLTASPTTSVAGTPLGPVQASLVDPDGAPIPLSGLMIQVAVGGGPTAELGGTTAQPTFQGVATFTDLSIATAGTGYSLVLTARQVKPVASTPFDILPASARSLHFKTQPKGGAAWDTMPAFEVDVVDEFGNVVPNVNVPVTVSVGQNPGVNLIHSSGSVGNPVLELVDPLTPALLPPLLTTNVPKFIAGMTFDPTSGKLLTSDTAFSFSSIHPGTGEQQFIGPPAALPAPAKGLALDIQANVLYAGMINDPNLYVIDPLTAAWQALGFLHVDGDTLLNLSGLAIDPTTGVMYGMALLLSDLNNRSLVAVDPSSMTAVRIGSTGDKPAGLAILPNGTMITVIGDGGSNAERLYTVNKSTGALTHLLTLGNGDSGECIATIPARIFGHTTAPTASGVATFVDMRMSAPGSSYTLYASAPGLDIGESRPFTVTAPDLSGKVQFTTSTASAGEASGTILLTLSLDVAKPHDVVAWVRAVGTSSGPIFPNPDHDFPTFIDVPVKIPAGATSAQIAVHWNNDAIVEPAETLVLTIQRVALGGIGAVNTLTLTVADND